MLNHVVEIMKLAVEIMKLLVEIVKTLVEMMTTSSAVIASAHIHLPQNSGVTSAGVFPSQPAQPA